MSSSPQWGGALAAGRARGVACRGGMADLWPERHQYPVAGKPWAEPGPAPDPGGQPRSVAATHELTWFITATTARIQSLSESWFKGSSNPVDKRTGTCLVNVCRGFLQSSCYGCGGCGYIRENKWLFSRDLDVFFCHLQWLPVSSSMIKFLSPNRWCLHVLYILMCECCLLIIRNSSRSFLNWKTWSGIFFHQGYIRSILFWFYLSLFQFF